MRRTKIRIRLKLYRVVLLGIIIFSIFLLVKFITISFSDNIGQAGFINKAFSYIGSSIIAKEPSLISYTINKNDQSDFLYDIISDRLALGKFVNENEALYTFAQSYPKSLAHDNEEAKDFIAGDDSQSGVRFSDSVSRHLGLEYILTNGAVIKSEAAGRLIWDEDISYDQLNIGYMKGDISPVPEDVYENENHSAQAVSGRNIEFTMEQLKNMNFLIKNFYIVDGTTVADSSLFDGEKLASADMTIKQGNDKPQILIFHTHSQEAFADSRPGVEEDTVVGMGALLAKVLREQYNYNVIHDKTYYDVQKGYNKSYSSAEAGLKKMLDKNPSIEVIIDIHRNSGKEKVVYINGKETAQIMMFNGLCRDHQGPMTKLENPYLQDNLALSLQMQLKSFDLYPGLFERNYLKAYRYNMHFRPKSMLVELGSVSNTVESARNATVLFAEVLDAVLKGNEPNAGNNDNMADDTAHTLPAESEAVNSE